ncbi:MAG: YeeE/YedE family protein [Hyphomicrobium sp.]
MRATAPPGWEAKPLREWVTASPSTALALGGLAIGVAFGWLTRAANYCLMGAVTDWRVTGDASRLGAAALAAGVAMIGAWALDAAGVVDIGRSMYLTPRINWIGALGGGFLFGVGMVYAGGCPSRALVRAGGGDVRAAFTLLVMAIAAYASLSGVLGGARVALDLTTALDLSRFGVASQDLPHVIATFAGAPAMSTTFVVAALVAILALRLIGPGDRWRHLAGGLGVGFIVTLGWALTGLAADDMATQPVTPSSLSFVKPVADAIDWIERSTALGWPSFAATSVFGVLAGGFAAALASRSLRVQGFADASDMKRHVFGAAAMGVGGVFALGCTIGQGVTGLSTLSIQSFLAVGAMLAGAVYAVERLQRSV